MPVTICPTPFISPSPLRPSDSDNMSLDAGGLAQMSYNNFPTNGGLGVPGSGFASRGKGSHIRPLNVGAQTRLPSLTENQLNANPTPRTSRSHLLAGLRTAPKAGNVPPSAPPAQTQFRSGLDGSKYANHDDAYATRGVPQTATGYGFPNVNQNQNRFSMNSSRQMYSLPEQILAPPALPMDHEQADDHMDPQLYAELVATNLYLAQQQQRLQQQLINVTAAAQQFQGLNLNSAGLGQQQFMNTPATPSMSFYNQQLESGIQPIIQPVANNPGLYTVYNPLTGQHSYFTDPTTQQNQYASSVTSRLDLNRSPPQPDTPTFRAQVSPPSMPNKNPFDNLRTYSPPNKTPSPQPDVLPLPPASANAFRRGHKKATSLASLDANVLPGTNGPKTGGLKSAGLPQTPMTGTFGPGQGRAGEHPVRQPRGPPNLDELVAKPTTKYEGSKNFSTRQRRRAVNSLVRAGIERRGVRASGSIGSAESLTPVSETEITFSISSDTDTDSIGNGALSGKPSLGSLRAVANGAIGSERKEAKERARERGSIDSYFTINSLSSDEGINVGGKLLEVKAGDLTPPGSGERRKTPMLVLTSAEKRKSSMF